MTTLAGGAGGEGVLLLGRRERCGGQQVGRARASWRSSEWLRREATRLGLPAVAARPWETVLERCIAVVDGMPIDPSPARA